MKLESKPGVMGATITLSGGGYFDFLDPKSSPIRITDIAVGLANTCRFSGQLKFCDDHLPLYYSVAQHSCLVSKLVKDSKYKLAALLHDAAEAYIGDVTSPLKQLIPEYKIIEKRIEQAIFEEFNIEYPLPECIKEADVRALKTEQRDLSSGSADNWNGLDSYIPDEYIIVPLSPQDAYIEFLKAYIYLT